MITKIVFTAVFFLLSGFTSFGQELTPAEEKIALLQKDIELMKKQMEFEKAKSDLANQRLKEIRDGIPDSSIKAFEGKTTYAEAKEKNYESVALSYAALKELSAKISIELKDDVLPYAGLVIYNEPDFLSLGKYRLYRSQAETALRNYDLLIEILKKLTIEKDLPNSKQGGKFRIRSSDPLMTALSIPSIGTSYASSIAELFAVFRTETTVTQTAGNIDDASLGAVMSNEVRKANPNLKIYFPQAFVAEYNLAEEGEDSLFRQITQINAANFILGEVILQIGKLPEEQRKTQEIKDTVALTEIVKKQLQSVAIENKAVGSGTDTDTPKTNLSEFRQLVRAEKLDLFLSNKTNNGVAKVNSKQFEEGKIGILKLRVLSAGGSRREKRNLFLGSKIDFSGSIVVEILLFDADGALRKSDIYSLHTGFRKMKRNENPK